MAATLRFRRCSRCGSNSYIFGGPVVPAYLDAVCTVVDILQSDEYQVLRARLDRHVVRMTEGLNQLDLLVSDGATPIISVLVGDEADTLRAGKFLFDQGFYVQSVLFPAVPYHGGVIRVQCNANHTEEAVDGLVDAFRALKSAISMPTRSTQSRLKTMVNKFLDEPRVGGSRDAPAEPLQEPTEDAESTESDSSFRGRRGAPNVAGSECRVPRSRLRERAPLSAALGGEHACEDTSVTPETVNLSRTVQALLELSLLCRGFRLLPPSPFSPPRPLIRPP